MKMEDYLAAIISKQYAHTPELRDRFAIAALIGMLAGNDTDWKDIPKYAYELADRMIDERDETR
tara:strand:- start:386 stop:577 length:192 start_codon:yes stop_codon:yes gene_type:complete